MLENHEPKDNHHQFHRKIKTGNEYKLAKLIIITANISYIKLNLAELFNSV